jgi:hypothetical protein
VYVLYMMCFRNFVLNEDVGITRLCVVSAAGFSRVVLRENGVYLIFGSR